MQAGLTNLLNTILGSGPARVHPVFRPEIWAISLFLWLVVALVWGAL